MLTSTATQPSVNMLRRVSTDAVPPTAGSHCGHYVWSRDEWAIRRRDLRACPYMAHVVTPADAARRVFTLQEERKIQYRRVKVLVSFGDVQED